MLRVMISFSVAAVVGAGFAFAQEPAPPDVKQVVPLEQLVGDALQSNLGLRSARAANRAVETAVQGARGNFDPVLRASPTFSTADRDLLLQPGEVAAGTESGRALNAGIDGTTPLSTSYAVSLDHDRLDQDNPLLVQNAPQPAANTALTFSLRQPLLRGFGPTMAKAPVRLADLGADASQERLERTAEFTIADVESAYWTLGLAEAFEDIARDSYERAQELLGRNEKMSELKLIADVDVITSKRGAAQRLTALTDATRRRIDAAERLWFLVYGEGAGETASRAATLGTEAPPTSAPEVPPAESIEARVLEERADVAAALLDREQAGLVERVAKNSLLPDLALNTSYSRRALGTEGFTFSSRNRPGDLTGSDWRVFASFSYPLWNRAARAAHARARWDAEVAELNVATAKTNVRSELRAASRAVRTQLERLEQSRVTMELARAQFDAGQQQLQLGIIDSFRLLQLEEDVANASLEHSQVRYDLAQAITSYQLATGTLLEKYSLAADPVQ